MTSKDFLRENLYDCDPLYSLSMKIIDGVFQLLTPFPQFSTAEARKIHGEIRDKPKILKGLPYVLPYLIISNGEVTLIDCGWNTDTAFEALTEGMKEHGVSPEALTKLIITHVHPDHFGMSGRLKELSNCEIVMHEKESDFVDSRYFADKSFTDEMQTDMQRHMQQHGVPELPADLLPKGSMNRMQNILPAKADTKVRGGEHLNIGDFDLEVVWTPGHAPGHICLYEENRRILFSGDHILPTITPNISIHVQSANNPLEDYISSLETVEKLDVDHVLPAHEFDIKELKRRILEIRDHHYERLDEMLKCVDAGATAWDVAGRVQWTTGTLADFDPFTQRAAVGETLAHLEYLFEEGRLSKVKREEQLFWIPV